MSSGYGMFLGLDVGKGERHAVGLDPTGKRLHDGPLPNSEPKLRALFDKLAVHGPLVVVDQPATIGALPVAVARAAGHQVAYLPGLAELDVRSASTTTSPVRPPASATASAVSSPPSTPALERAIGSRITHSAVLEILWRCGGPAGIREAGRRKPTTIATKHVPRMGERLVAAILTALDEQTVTVPGTTAADNVLPRLADSLKTVLAQCKQVTDEVEEIRDAHPLAGVLISMPDIGVRTAARILLEIGDATNDEPVVLTKAHRHQHARVEQPEVVRRQVRGLLAGEVADVVPGLPGEPGDPQAEPHVVAQRQADHSHPGEAPPLSFGLRACGRTRERTDPPPRPLLPTCGG
ncbi:transposase [Actinokineospora auranticolor]|uniref:Transposase n=1 Tax=Actinokineospora auranticolor TaxID=155976 RepID=A0A2S6GTC9_9PSEU|nr:transposase [Actinokineospora auranticolor]